MSTGLRCWDEQGNLTVDLTSRLSRVVGQTVITAGQSGSVQVDASLGRPWYFFTWGRFPAVTINGGTISWDASARDSVLMIYGVY